MAGQPRSPKKLRGHDRGLLTANGPLFFANLDTIEKLEEAAGRNFGGRDLPYKEQKDSIDPHAVFLQLDMAFLGAHAQAEQVRKTPPPSELRDAYDQVLRTGKAFLMALGIAVNDHAELFRKDWRELRTASGVLNALVHEPPVEPSRLVSEDTLNLIDNCNQLAETLNEVAAERGVEPMVGRMTAAEFAPPGNRPILEAVRNIGYLLAVAKASRDLRYDEAASSGPTPATGKFNSVLLYKLVECYELMFGEMPVIRVEPQVFDKEKQGYSGVTEDGNRIYLGDRDPVVKWFRTILEIALSRIEQVTAPLASGEPAAEQPCTRVVRRPPSVKVSGSLELAKSIRTLQKCNGLTMAEYISDGIRVAKARRAEANKGFEQGQATYSTWEDVYQSTKRRSGWYKNGVFVGGCPDD